MIKLRPYQKNAIKAAYDAIRADKRKFLLSLATGAGKSIIIASIAKDAISKGMRVVVITNAETLCFQIAETLEKVTGLDCCIEKAAQVSKADSVLISASVQSLSAPGRAERLHTDNTLIIFDEAHMALAETYSDVLERLNAKYMIGFTATPFRADDTPMAGVWPDGVVFSYNIMQAIKDGYLTPLKGLLRSHGGWVKGDNCIEAIANDYRKGLWRKANVVFVPLLQHAEDLASAIGEGADWVSADRRQPIKEFEDGKLHTIITSTLLVTGWDCPRVDCIVLARSMDSLVMLSQSVGRGTRLYDGKDDCLVIDYSGDLINLASIMAPNEGTAKSVAGLFDAPDMDGEFDILDAWDQIQEDSDRQERDRLETLLNRRSEEMLETFDPLNIQISIDSRWGTEDVLVSDMTWDFLRTRFGLFDKDRKNLSERFAQYLIGALGNRERLGLCSYKQCKKFASLKYKGFELWTKEKAKKVMMETIENRFRPIKRYQVN